MRSKPSPLYALLAVMALLAASCGVSREASGDVLDTITTTVESTTAPPSTVAIPIPAYVAPDYDGIDTAVNLTFEDGSTAEIPIDDLSSVVKQIEANPDVAGVVFADGLPLDFDLGVLSTLIQVELIKKGLADADTTVPAGAVVEQREDLSLQIEGIVAGDADPVEAAADIEAGISNYLDVLAEQRAVQDTFTTLYEEAGDVDVPCTRHILLDTEADADAAIDRLNAGEDFAELAIELSTGPSGPQGGDLGCSDPGGFVAEFRDAVVNATEGEVVGPVETQFGFHVILVYGSDVVPADPSVAQQRAFEAYTVIQDGTIIEVDPGIGMWDPVATRVVASAP